MRVYYGKAVYGKEEIASVRKVLLNKSLTLIDGPLVKELEKKIAILFGKKYGLMVNSGSSANLLAISCFNFNKDSEIITPTLTFSTTVAPIFQLGYTPHFIDVQKNSFVASIDQIESAINKKTVAIMLPNLIGNVPYWPTIFKIAKKYNLKVIEDSADTIGYTYKKKNFGKYSDVVTNSLYASHIITGAGFGGIVCFNNKKNYERAKLLRGWGRSSAIFNESEGIEKRFSQKVDGVPYDGKYIFVETGYNFLPSEISAAFALQQLKKLKKNISIREKNFLKLKSYFSNHPNVFDLPVQDEHLKTPWLAYPVLLKKNLNFNRRDLQIFLEKKGIQTRTIFTGNILRQPIMKNKKFKKVKKADLNSNVVMEYGMLIGCHHGMTEAQLKFIINSFEKFLKIKKII